MSGRLPEPLVATLGVIASTASELRDPWWIYGGAAMALAGLNEPHVPDVDVLASARNAHTLIRALHGQVSEDPGEGLFRSQVFGQILTTPVPVDVMAEMDVRAGVEWTRVTFESRIPIKLEGAVVFIPSVEEQIDTCRLFGRPKDLERAERLEALIRR
ncbi:hypothetical protein Q0812_03860 [Brevundimonas sp. 2R-24]|uniref:Nucleotidyltransferase AbiEii toxin of type IV toxin-antitoxin system n=1 Tax=Peiella sedimenti TaxID=3061083 RepID=A0ABT8SJ99_9CAUL|nr:hypothetical protein [Caulobacteraceae bacterium XZ-24]